jgi:hypothetical protein
MNSQFTCTIVIRFQNRDEKSKLRKKLINLPLINCGFLKS